MSILIRGMEMPTDCHNCPLGFGGGCYCGTSADEYMCPDHGRAEWCPLLPVPPHGRLIDADALRQSIKESIDECHKWAEEVDEGEMYARVSQALGTFVECSLRVKAAPTIIPAEEG